MLATLAPALLAVSASIHESPPAGAWHPVAGTLLTRWAHEVDPSAPWNEYPRPQLRRATWTNLNGLWEYAIRPLDGGLDFPARADGTILVPFPLESALSGVGRSITKDERLFYRRTFVTQSPKDGLRAFLRFGAVDWGMKLWVNGREIGDHTGGFDPFSFDVTTALRDGENEILITAWDPCDEASEYEPPRGKQVRSPEGIWYTSVTGIWQTVWLEVVPERRIERVRFATRADGTITAMVNVAGPADGAPTVEVRVGDPDGASDAPLATGRAQPGQPCELRVRDPRWWSPESPVLYPVEISFGSDRATSYLAFRTVELARGAAGRAEILLNGKPYFMLGPLDQGWWPDGLYAAPTAAASRYDLEVTKALGFNTVRKHVKIEPDTWYADCDRLGLLVWQDMPSSGPSIGPNDPDAERGAMPKRVYETELVAMIERLAFHPCIVMWVPFNEGWGQFETQRIVELVRATDPTRLVNNASGWTDRGAGDVFDVHDYAASLAGHAPRGDDGRALVIGEFGGLGLPIPGHLWRESGWGYRSFKTPEELTVAYERLLAELADLRSDGVCAAIYTQTTDVEIEVNGLMTYDRDVIKMNSARVFAANAKVLRAQPRTYSVVTRCARDGEGPMWRYTTDEPSANWATPGFDDRDWSLGAAGFGTQGTPGAIVGTVWETPSIWIRRVVRIAGAAPTHLAIHHDEDAEVFVDGTLVARLEGFTTNYARVPLSAEAIALLSPGEHVIAIRARQTRGGQFIDAGFVRAEE